MTGRAGRGTAVGGPLSHLRVVELTDGLSAAYCARQFASSGADVTVVEAPGGSPMRRLEPLIEDDTGAPADSKVDGNTGGLTATAADGCGR